MRIAFDGDPLAPPLTGPGKYAARLLEQMVRLTPGHEYVVVYSRPLTTTCGRQLRALALPRHATVTTFCRERIEQRLWRRTRFSRLDLSLRADVYHGSGFKLLPSNRRPRVLTVHDVSMYRFAGRLHPRVERMRDDLQRDCARADVVLTVSEFARREISDFFSIPPERIVVTYNGVDEVFRPATSEERQRARERYAGGRPYLLHVGTFQPRKNLVPLVRAFDHLRTDGSLSHALVLAGSWGWKYDDVLDALARARARESIHVLDYLPDADIAELYRGADSFVLPSFYEGFGIPALEAMASGVPVVSSTGGALPEIVGDCAVMIDPARAEAELVEAIPRVLADTALREHLVRAGLQRAASFNWTDTATRTLEVYDRLTGARTVA